MRFIQARRTRAAKTLPQDGTVGRPVLERGSSVRGVEHVDHTWASGTTAGANMAGGQEAYDYTPLFYSDLFDDGYEAIGHLDTSLEMLEVWSEDRSAAVVHYLDGGQVAGILLWNTWDSVPTAREVMAASRAGRLRREEPHADRPRRVRRA